MLDKIRLLESLSIMGKKTFIILALVLQIFSTGLFCNLSEAEAAIQYLDQSDAGTTLNVAGDTYVLTEDITCTGDGFVIGANGITIDGGYHTLTGDGGFDQGIDNSGGWDNITIQNFGTSVDSGISHFGIGISLSNSTGSIIQNNTANLNASCGIGLVSSPSSTLTNNITNSNSYGIYLTGSGSSTLTGNTANFNVNTSCHGIYLNNSPSCTLTNNITNSNAISGIYLLNSPSTLTGNTADLNYIGISLNSSASILNSNTINSSSGYGIKLISSTPSTITGNTIFMSGRSFSDDQVTDNTYQNNQFLHLAINPMLTFSETSIPGIKNLNDTISFTVTAKKPNGTAYANGTVITTSPSEASLSYSDNGSGLVTGSFMPTRTGTYSLNIVVTDSDGNIAKRNYTFLVGDTNTQTTTYYIRYNSPNHGQPRVIPGSPTDVGSLLFTKATGIEELSCSDWTQNSIDEMPDFPLAYLNAIDSHFWYSQTAFGGPDVGVERYLTYSDITDVSSPSVVTAWWNYRWADKEFTDLNWTMDYLSNWYLLTWKIDNGAPFITAFPPSQEGVDKGDGIAGGAEMDSWIAHHNNDTGVTDSSYINFSYQYTTTPAVKSISNTDIIVLSATASVADPDSASIVLDGTGDTDIVLDAYKRPFSGYTTTITPTTATLAATGLVGQTAIESINMDITPNAGSIEVAIDTWNTGGNRYKNWTETGADGVASATHRVGDLQPNSDYKVIVDDVEYDVYTSNADGEISFNYTGGYSTNVFEVEDVTPPTVSSTNPANLTTELAINATVNATFSEMMNAATITDATFTLKQGETAIDGAVTYDADTKTATFTPTDNLRKNRTYTATITGGVDGVKDLAGNAMAANYSWSFMTAESTTHYLYQEDVGSTLDDPEDIYIVMEDISCPGVGFVIGADYIIIDGGNHTLTGDGLNYGINNSGGWDNITVRNFANITNFTTGVYLNNSTGSTVQNVTANANSSYGIYASSSESTTLTNNTTNHNDEEGINLFNSGSSNLTSNTANYNKSIGISIGNSSSAVKVTTLDGNTAKYNWDTGVRLQSSSYANLVNNNVSSNNLIGIYLDSSGYSTLSGNIIHSNYGDGENAPGIFLSLSSNSILDGNTFSDNMRDLKANNSSDVTYVNNQFLHNGHNFGSPMLIWPEISREVALGGTVSFDNVDTYKADGTACDYDAGCTAVISVSPSEPSFQYTNTGNTLSGSFTATRKGTYSLSFTITDSENNVTKRNYLFFVGPTSSASKTLYVRNIDTTHGQPYGNGHDARSFVSTVPDEGDTEVVWCGAWVQNSPDELPDFPLASLTGISAHYWYKSTSVGTIGIQRFTDFNYLVDQDTAIPISADYSLIERNLTGFNWSMDYPKSWYYASVKMLASNVFVQSTNAQPSSADFTYSYTTTPAVKSISNTDINVLSATEPGDDPGNAQIVLNGTGDTDIVLDNFKRPFSGYTTTITPTTATLAATGLVGQTAIESINMDITPNAGSIEVAIDTWNTGGNRYKNWTETGADGVASATHRVGDLQPNSDYKVIVDDVVYDVYTSNADGEINFNYTGGYSTKTFEVEAAPTVATPTFSPTGGTFKTGKEVTISCETDGATIYYTTDGTDPTDESEEYTEPLAVSATKTLKAKAYLEDWNASEIGSARFVINIKLRFDIDEDGTDDLAGLGNTGNIHYSTNKTSWTQIPGRLTSLTTGDLDGDGSGDIAGLIQDESIWYTTNKTSWTKIIGNLRIMVSGDYDGDGDDDLAGVSRNRYPHWTTNKISWTKLPGLLAAIASGDLNADGRIDLMGLSTGGNVYYSTNKTSWAQIPGTLASIASGNVNGDNNDDIIGLDADGTIWYTTDRGTWTHLPQELSKLYVGDVNGDGTDDLIGLKSDNTIWYTLNKTNWIQIQGHLSALAIGDFDGNGTDDIAGLGAAGSIWSTTNKTSWTRITGTLSKIYSAR